MYVRTYVRTYVQVLKQPKEVLLLYPLIFAMQASFTHDSTELLIKAVARGSRGSQPNSLFWSVQKFTWLLSMPLPSLFSYVS